MNREELIAALGKMLAGLQVPLSLGGPRLGAAAEPYREILRDSGFGWRDADEFADYLRRRLDAPAEAEDARA